MRIALRDDLPPLRDVIAKHDLRARKALGQNFLLDLNLTGRIARTAGDLTDMTVVEVGPGPGGLTRALLAHGAKNVVAIEQDSRCLPALREISTHYPGRLNLIEGDALEIDVHAHIDGRACIIANLPYNVGTALLTGWLSAAHWPPWWASLTLMFQREVAERIVSPPSTKAFGRLSVLAQWRSNARIAFDVPAKAFTPAPKVTSSVVHIVPTEAPVDVDVLVLQRVAKAAFSQRRKMLRQSLKGLVSDPLALLADAKLDPTRRAETLTIGDFVTLARILGTQ